MEARQGAQNGRRKRFEELAGVIATAYAYLEEDRGREKMTGFQHSYRHDLASPVLYGLEEEVEQRRPRAAVPQELWASLPRLAQDFKSEARVTARSMRSPARACRPGIQAGRHGCSRRLRG